MSWTYELMQLFQELQIVRTKDVCAAGIPTMYLTRLVRDGSIHRVCHATYVPVGQPLRLATVLREIAVRMPHAIASLGTAAAVHELEHPDTSRVFVTLPMGSKPPSRSAVPIEAFWERPRAYGVQAAERSVGQTAVRIYGPEKTVTDFFKYRSRIGIARAVSVLDAYLASGHRDLEALARCAETNRMSRVMGPYLEACQALRLAEPEAGRVEARGSGPGEGPLARASDA